MDTKIVYIDGVDWQHEVGEMVLLHGPTHRRIERREVHLRPRRIGLWCELHADRVQGRRVIGADAMIGEALEVHVDDTPLVGVGF